LGMKNKKKARGEEDGHNVRFANRIIK
jgi:hypothetical protein